MEKGNVMDFEALVKMMGQMVEVSKDTTEKLKQRVDLMDGDINYLKQKNQVLASDLKDVSRKLNDTTHTATNALEKISLRDENDFGQDWLNQTDLGLMYEPSISSFQIGLILKQIGLAKKNTGKTTPLRIAHGNGWVRRGYAHNYTSWYWFAPVVKDKFIDFLKENNIYDEFLCIKTDDDMREFIKDNFDKRVK